MLGRDVVVVVVVSCVRGCQSVNNLEDICRIVELLGKGVTTFSGIYYLGKLSADRAPALSVLNSFQFWRI